MLLHHIIGNNIAEKEFKLLITKAAVYFSARYYFFELMVIDRQLVQKVTCLRIRS